LQLERIPFDLHSIFSRCQSILLPSVNEKGLNLCVYIESKITKRLLGDPLRLYQVLTNLLSNAVKFTNTGTIWMSSAIIQPPADSPASDNTITIYFEIKDSGIGMTTEQMEKIFSPFTQAETGTTRKYGGTGLGLSIAKNIVELMGGEFFVESTPNVGSKFSFKLNFETVDVCDDEVLEEKINITNLEKPMFEGEILLCEDNVMNQQVICEHLARVGLRTVVAENGKIGVEMVKNRKEKGEKQFDLIFMDVHMPVMDGLEAAGKIIELETGIPIVTMTANIMLHDRELYKKIGMSDYVGKPFTSNELWHCLLKYFKTIEKQPDKENQIMKNEEEYQRIFIDAFMKSNQTKFSEITAALDAGDIKTAHRLAHSLKGNAAQIGKADLQKAAAAVEEQLKDGENKVTRQQLAALETELSAVLAEFTSSPN